jgi:hypothetical protein
METIRRARNLSQLAVINIEDYGPAPINILVPKGKAVFMYNAKGSYSLTPTTLAIPFSATVTLLGSAVFPKK